MNEEWKDSFAKLILDKVELTAKNKLLNTENQRHLRIKDKILRNDKKISNDEIEHLQAMIEKPEEMADEIKEYRAELLAYYLWELNPERREYH